LGRYTHSLEVSFSLDTSLSYAHTSSVAVGAFILVFTLDMARRENDKKVIAVKMKMHELMLIFFE